MGLTERFTDLLSNRKVNSLYLRLLTLNEVFDTKKFKLLVCIVLSGFPLIITSVCYYAYTEIELPQRRELGEISQINLLVFWNIWLFQLANGFLFLSYIQVNFFYLRLVLILSSICFGTWAWFYLNVALDTLIWSCVYFVLNVVLAIPLFLNWLPVRLSVEEKILFDKYFCKFVSKKHFKILISIAQSQTFYSPIDLCTKGNPIKHVIFLSHISKNSEITVYKDGTILLGPLDGYWVGVNDAFEAIHEGAQDVKWTIDCKVTKASEHEFVSIVIFPLDKLRNVFKNSKYGLQIKQTMCALWLENNCDVIARLNLTTSIIYREAEALETEQNEDVDPNQRSSKTAKYITKSLNNMNVDMQVFKLKFNQESYSRQSESESYNSHLSENNKNRLHSDNGELSPYHDRNDSKSAFDESG